MFALFGVLFLAYATIYRVIDGTNDRLFYGAIGLAVLFRFVLLGAFPNLSDDIYRFVWDGRLWAAGISPFAYLPSDFFNGNFVGEPPANLNPQLYASLNSPDYYSIYPPVCQWILWLSAVVSPHSVSGAAYVIKAVVFTFECGTLLLLCVLLKRLQLPLKYALIYALNPLVIVELVGNIHFEAVMIFFLLLAVWCWQNYEQAARFGDNIPISGWLTATAVCFGLAICSKLLPLIFLPFFIARLGILKSGYFFGIIGMVILLCFAPIIEPALLPNFLASVKLYYQSFEFNASVYYIIRQVGYWLTGYNVIAFSGKLMAICSLTSITLMAWRETGRDTLSLLQAFLFALFVYFVFANIVHPWYVCGLLALSVFYTLSF